MRYFQRNAVGTSIWPEVTRHGFIMRNCYIAYSGTRDNGIGYGVDLHFSDVLIENNTIHDNGRRNISFNIVNTTGSCTMRDIIIQDNYLYSGWHTTGIDIGTHGLNHTVRNIVIRRNRIYEDPTVDKSDYPLAMVFIENNGDAGDIDSVFFYSNIIQNTSNAGLMLGGISHAHVINSTSTGLEV